MLRFQEFETNDENLLKDFLEEAKRTYRSYFLYFVIYRSPRHDNEACLYVGIKYKNVGHEEPPEKFWGSLRYDPLEEKNIIQDKSVWEKSQIKVDVNDNISLGQDKGVYMSSAGKHKHSESLGHAFKKGIIDRSIRHHPCILNDTTEKTLDYLLSSLFDNSDDSPVYSELSKQVDDIRKEKNQKGAFTIPHGKDLNSFPLTKEYGYRIYVCGDTNLYSDIISELSLEKESSSNKEFELRKGGKKVIDDEEKNIDKNTQASIEEQAEHVTKKYFEVVQQFYKTNSQFKVPKEFEDQFDFMDFIEKKISENKQPLHSPAIEWRVSRRMHDDDVDEKTQDKSTKLAYRDITTFQDYYLPEMSENESKALCKFIQDFLKEYPQKTSVRSDKNFSEEQILEIGVKAHISNESPDSARFRQFARSFTKFGNFEETGIQNGDSRYNLLYNSSENNLLVRARDNNDSEAKEELKKRFIGFELPLLYKFTPKGKINEFILRIGKNNKDYVIFKSGQKLSEVSWESLSSDYMLHNGMTKTELLDVHIFNLYDFLKLIGFDRIEKNHKIDDIFKKYPTIKESIESYDEVIEEDVKKNLVAMAVMLGAFFGGNAPSNSSPSMKPEIQKTSVQKEKQKYQQQMERTKMKKMVHTVDIKEKYNLFGALFANDIITGKEKFSKYFIEVNGRENEISHQKLVKTLKKLANRK